MWRGLLVALVGHGKGQPLATELGVAYVNILASVKDLAKSAAPGFADIEKHAGTSGDKSAGFFTDKFKAVGVLAAAGAGVALGAALSSSFGSALELGKANDKLAAQLGLTGPEAEKAGKIAGDLYAGAYGDSMDEVNTAVAAVLSSIKGMSDAPAADVESMTAKVLDLSSAFELDASRAAQVAGQMITSGLAVDGVHAADLLAASLQKVPAAVREDVLDAVDEYAPFMSSLGIEGETAMGLLVNASEKGMYGIDKLGDSLKEFTIRSTDMSKATGDAYATLGMDQTTMTNALLAGGDTAETAFADIIHGLQTIDDPALQAQTALALFGTPLEDLGTSEIPNFLGQIDPMGDAFDSVAGAAEDMGNTLNDNAATKIESFKRTMQTGFVNFLGNQVLPAAESFTAWVRDKFGPIFAQIAGFVQDNVMPALSSFGGFIRDTVVPAVKDLGVWMKDNQTVLQGVAVAVLAGVAAYKAMLVVSAISNAVKTFSAAAKIAAVQQWLLNSAMLANPVALVVAGIAALVAGLVWFFTQTETGRKIVEAAWAGIQVAVAAVVDWFNTNVMPVLTTVWNTIAAGAKWLWEEAIKPAWDGIMAAVAVVVTWFQTVLMPAVKTVFDTVGGIFTWLYENIVQPVFSLIGWYIGTWWTLVSGIFQVAVAIIQTYLAPVFTWLWENIIKPVFGFIGTLIATWWAGAKVVFNAAVWFFQNILAPVFTWLWEKIIRPVFNFIGSLFSTWWAGAKIIFEAVGNFLRNTLGPAFTWLRDNIITPVWNAIKSVIETGWNDGIKPIFEALAKFVKEDVPKAFESAKEGIVTAWDKIKEAAKKPVKFVIETVINGLISTFNKIPGVDIKKVALPPGFKNGGYTGDGPADEVAGPAHRGEFYFTKKQTAAIGKDKLYAMARNAGRGGAAASIGEGNMGGFFEGNASAIRRHGAYYLNVPASMNPWGFGNAARMWDGAAGVKVAVGRGSLQGQASARERGGGILGYTTGNNIDMSPSWMAQLGAKQRQTVAAHEMGHALGLPHNSLRSIMQPNLGQMAPTPTPVDVRNLQKLYPGGSGKAGDGSVDNPFDGAVDKLMGAFKKQFPDGGMFVDVAGGLAKSGIDQVVKWVSDIKDGIKDVASDVVDKIKGFFGGGSAMAPTLYDNGGVLAPNGGRPQLVQNKTRKPELIHTLPQMDDRDTYMRAVGAAGAAGSGHQTVIQVENMFGSADQIADELSTKQRRAAVMHDLRKVMVAA